MRAEVLFEYAFFLNHVDVGYRADLCAWDWQRRFHTLEERPKVKGQCRANRGWQASGLSVTSGDSYAFRADGKWGVRATSEHTTADGHADGHGRLTGIVLDDFQLSRPFPLGARGNFVAPATGKLYLRCHDAWNQLSDNSGDVYVEFTAAGK
jgi:hypothetical protein